MVGLPFVRYPDSVMDRHIRRGHCARRSIVQQAALHRLPAIYEVRTFVDPGGLVAYGPDLSTMYCGAAIYVDKIFKVRKLEIFPSSSRRSSNSSST